MNEAEKQAYLIDHSKYIIANFYYNADNIADTAFIGSVYSEPKYFECVLYNDAGMVLDVFHVTRDQLKGFMADEHKVNL